MGLFEGIRERAVPGPVGHMMMHDKTLDPSLLRRPRLVFLILPVSTGKPKRELP